MDTGSRGTRIGQTPMVWSGCVDDEEGTVQSWWYAPGQNSLCAMKTPTGPGRDDSVGQKIFGLPPTADGSLEDET